MPVAATNIEGLREMGVAEARENWHELLEGVSSGKQGVVELCRRDIPKALLLPHGQYIDLIRPLLAGEGLGVQRKHLLSWIIAHQWLGAAPAHLLEPQRKELMSLPIKELVAIFLANPERPDTDALQQAGIAPKILDRIKKRRKVAQALRQAEVEGLFESAEHATSAVDLEDDG